MSPLPREASLEPLGIADLPAVLAIESASFPSPWTEENFRHEILANPRAWNVVLRDGGVVAAYACCYLVADELQINDLAVDPDRRSRGWGGAILDALLAEARARGASRATLEVRPSNAAGRRLYRSRGFRAVGRRPGYYADTGEDALLMERPL